MAKLDVSSYLIEVSPDSPCGDNLEYDPLYLELLRVSEGKPERQVGNSIIPAVEPEWQQTKLLALELLEKTRDIEVAVFLTRAAAFTDGFEGVRQGLSLIKGLLQRFWKEIYPRQDPDDAFPMERMNALRVLNDYQGFLSLIRDIPLTDSKNFKVSLRDVDISTGKITTNSENKTPLNDAQINAAFMDCSKEAIQRNLKVLDAALFEVTAISAITAERCGEINSPDLSGLSDLLKEIIKVISAHSPESSIPMSESMGAGSLEHAENSDDVGHVGMEGEGRMDQFGSVNNRQDVVRTIDLICDYYDLNEPASPVPLLLRRAKRMVDMDFFEILKEIAPDGVDQASSVCAPDNDSKK